MEDCAVEWLKGLTALSLFDVVVDSWLPPFFGVVSVAWLAIAALLTFISCVLLVCLLLLLPLPRGLRCTYFPAVIGRGALTPQPPNLALLFTEDPRSAYTSCSNCNSRATRSWGYLMRLSGLVRPMHAQHKRGLLGTLGCPSVSSSASSPELTKFVPPHSVVERFSGWGGESPVASPHFSHHPSGAAELHRPLDQRACGETSLGLDGAAFWGAHYLPAAETAAGGGISPASEVVSVAKSGSGKGLGQCKACRLAASWLQPPAPSRQQLLLACPSLSKGFCPDSVLLQHRLVQGILLYLQEETNLIQLIKFDRQYWVTSVDGDVVLLHYYRHRTDPKACSSSWGPADAASAAEGVGCTDGRFPHGKPHGHCGCRGILFIVGGEWVVSWLLTPAYFW